MSDSDSSDDVPRYVLMSEAEREEELRRLKREVEWFDSQYVDEGCSDRTERGVEIIHQIARTINELGLDVRVVATNIRAFDLIQHLWNSEAAALKCHNDRVGSDLQHSPEACRLKEMCECALRRSDSKTHIWCPVNEYTPKGQFSLPMNEYL
ncbi:hypothetical protein BDZ97DRAFT_1765626 [Flammula alnicola]|nr:hypothetical protein BDZ97DRAFT_1765626 [Flammula alnicola]